MPAVSVPPLEITVGFCLVFDCHSRMAPLQFLIRNAYRYCAQQDRLSHRPGLREVRFGFLAAQAGVHEMMVMIARRKVRTFHVFEFSLRQQLWRIAMLDEERALR